MTVRRGKKETGGQRMLETPSAEGVVALGAQRKKSSWWEPRFGSMWVVLCSTTWKGKCTFLGERGKDPRFRDYQIQDGVALVKYFSWLEETRVKSEQAVNETKAADVLEKYRVEQAKYEGLSFLTIRCWFKCRFSKYFFSLNDEVEKDATASNARNSEE
ncbi:hypothetical protein DL96DRAFT_1775764 [Flagelloscypha sp. PMI_526]|nr:hypothetical protein DL96DRAFT_1775764 [Flagelloscypha sp. PMI_526]